MAASPDDDLAFAPIAEIAPRLRAKQVTSAALTRLMLDRIARHNPAA